MEKDLRQHEGKKDQESRASAFQGASFKNRNYRSSMGGAKRESVRNGYQICDKEFSSGEIYWDFDGITSEMLYHCWRFSREDCFNMIRAYWMDRVMSSVVLLGVIKLISKDGYLS